MTAWITLADFAQVHAGKLFVVGGGASVVGVPAQFGVGVEIIVPWANRSKAQEFRVDLVDADGRQASFPSPVAGTPPPPFQLKGQVVVNPATGVKEGSDISAVVAFNVVGMPLAAGASYTLRLFVGSDTEPTAKKTFSTLPMTQFQDPAQ
jgi:hypothetical protein